MHIYTYTTQANSQAALALHQTECAARPQPWLPTSQPLAPSTYLALAPQLLDPHFAAAKMHTNQGLHCHSAPSFAVRALFPAKFVEDRCMGSSWGTRRREHATLQQESLSKERDLPVVCCSRIDEFAARNHRFPYCHR